MSMFDRSMKIGEGQKFDATKVSESGLSEEELSKLKEKDRKKIDIFNKDGVAGLSKQELAEALSSYSKYAGDDNKLSNKELKQMAKDYGVKAGDLKRVLKLLLKLINGKDDLISVGDAIKSDTGIQTADIDSQMNIDELNSDQNIDFSIIDKNLTYQVNDKNVRNLDEVSLTGNVSLDMVKRESSRVFTNQQTGEKSVHNYVYDEQGRKSQVNVSNGEVFEYLYEGDSKNPTKMICKDKDGNVTSTKFYEYDSKGELVEIKTINPDGSEYVVQNEPIEDNAVALNDVVLVSNVESTYEDTNLVAAKNIKFSNGTESRIEYEYDSQGRKMTATFDDGNRIQYTYAGNSVNVSELVLLNADGAVISSESYDYNPDGTISSEKYFDENHNLIELRNMYYVDGREVRAERRDSSGNIIQIDETSYLADGTKVVNTRTIDNNTVIGEFAEAYDAKGNLIEDEVLLAQILPKKHYDEG